MGILNNIAAIVIADDYEKVAKQITNMIDKLDQITQRATAQYDKIDDEIKKLEDKAEDISVVVLKANKLKTNLNKLFE